MSFLSWRRVAGLCRRLRSLRKKIDTAQSGNNCLPQFRLSENLDNPGELSERNHVGKHVLKALRDCQDSLKDGIVVSSCYHFYFVMVCSFLDRTQPVRLVWALPTLQDSANQKRKPVLDNIKLRIPLCHHGLLESSDVQQVYSMQ